MTAPHAAERSDERISGTRPSFLMPLMAIATKTDPTIARINNRMMVFNLLFPNAAMSRAQIGRRTGLSRVSVSEVVSELIDAHILMEAGRENPSRRGKKGTLVGVDPLHWNIVAIDLSQPRLIRGAVTNILGFPLERIERPVPRGGALEAKDVVDLAVELAGRASGEPLGVGIAVPGVVDDHGTVVDSNNLGWSGLALGEAVTARLGLPCVVDNDANSALLTERFFGEAGPNALFVQITSGVGAALLIDDSIVLGENHASGEIGHVVVDEHGPECVCGRRGCLEAVIAPNTLRRRILADGEDPAMVLGEAGRLLGRTLAMATSLIDLNDMAVWGPHDIVDDAFLKGAEDAINDFAASHCRTHITVRRCEYGDDIVLRGESISVLQSALRRI